MSFLVDGSGYYIAAKAVQLAFRYRDGYTTRRDGGAPHNASIAIGIIKNYFKVERSLTWRFVGVVLVQLCPLLAYSCNLAACVMMRCSWTSWMTS